MPRRLVTVRRVAGIEAIPGTNRVVVAKIDGWACIVPARQFKAGDFGVFFEIDSFLPAADPRWAQFEKQFRSNADGKEGYLVRTEREHKRLSQGYLLPLDKKTFPEIVKIIDQGIDAALAANDNGTATDEISSAEQSIVKQSTQTEEVPRAQEPFPDAEGVVAKADVTLQNDIGALTLEDESCFDSPSKAGSADNSSDDEDGNASSRGPEGAANPISAHTHTTPITREQAFQSIIMTMSFEGVLGVTKFEAPGERKLNNAAGAGTALREFPHFIMKTEQERIQNIKKLDLRGWQREIFQETTKMDGTSVTVYFVRSDSPYIDWLPTSASPDTATASTSTTRATHQPNGRVGVCSRNKDIPEASCPDPAASKQKLGKTKGKGKPKLTFPGIGPHWHIARSLSLPAKLSKLNRSLALQGELVGATIQQNAEGFPEGHHDMYLFNTWDIAEQRNLPPRETEELAAELGIKHVPVVGYASLREISPGGPDGLLKRAEGEGVNGKAREGIVLKHVGGDFSFKVVANSHLLKKGGGGAEVKK